MWNRRTQHGEAVTLMVMGTTLQSGGSVEQGPRAGLHIAPSNIFLRTYLEYLSGWQSLKTFSCNLLYVYSKKIIK